MTQPIAPIHAGELEVTAQEDAHGLHLRLRGTADMSSMEALDQFLVKVHARARERGAGEVIVDLRPLDFMNSSCFKSFVRWLSAVQQLDTPAQYRIRMLSDPSKHWQRRSLHALSCFAGDLVQVES